MKKMVIFMALVSSLVLISGSALAQKIPDWALGGAPGAGATVCAPYMQIAWNGIEDSWLIGQSVMSPEGDTLGQISDLVIDQANDRTALIILSDVPFMGARVVAVPYSSVTRSGEHTFELSFGDRELEVPSGNTDLYLYHMTKLPAGSDLYGIPPVMDPNWVAEVYNYYGQVPYWTEKGLKPIAATELYRSSKLMGAEVRLPEGEGVAKVDDLVINSSDGQVAFLSLRNVAGRGDALVAVPFSTLSRNGDNSVTLSIAKEKMAAAPTFNESRDVNNRAWAESVYSLFGVQPCWGEEGTR